MKTAEIRQKFLSYFESKGHTIVPSSSLVPHDDPTLLFTNAGMNQFKDVFLGFDKRPYSRAVTAQKCVRAGGKHNDLENVGYTARHHTFFEMMGNFSFGDYFKHDAIRFAWEFLTSPQYLNLPQERLLVTVYADDDEAYDIWHQDIGLPAEKIIRIGDNKGAQYASDNFWTMGDTGPCGPCSEIFYDHGDHVWGGPPGSAEEDGDRFIEIWNNVFMQFNRDDSGQMHLLPRPSVDTGMGLERITAVLQHVHSNYEIDLFVDLLQAAARATGVAYNQDTPSLKVIADHIRACSFLIADGVLPSNEGRGYVLRRIIRRAVRHGYKLGQNQPFFHTLVADLVRIMGAAYPELCERQALIAEQLRLEETRFAQTLETGMGLLEQALAEQQTVLSGAVIFKLYDTYGFPYDLTADICRERDIELDEAGFNREMEAQRARARAAKSFKADVQLDYTGADSVFEGYLTNESQATVLALYRGNEAVDALHEGETGVVVLSNTPFYAESGGQIGDTGVITALSGRFEVADTQKIKAAVFGQYGQVAAGSIHIGEKVNARIDGDIRAANMRNHSATHLMHAALREVLGVHVEQKGSLVTAERTRFDLSHPQAVSAEEITRVENIVNQAILANVAVEASHMTFDDAIAAGAMALFGEKYGDEVRVLKMGDFSTELCGGIHVGRTGDIGLFKIVSEQGIAAGVRRLEAVTGLNALAWAREQEQLLKNVVAETKAQTADDIITKVQAQQAQLKQLEKALTEANSKLAAHAGAALLADAKQLAGARLIVKQMDAVDGNALRDITTDLTAQGDDLVVLLASVVDGKISLCAGVSKALSKTLKAGDLVKAVAEQVGGKGGGRADLAQAGGSNVAALPAALASIPAWLASR